MPASGPSASPFARGGGHSDGTAGLVNCHPSEHAEKQFVGFFRGLGTTSKEPICNKRNSSLKRLHDGTHFAVGCKMWDEGGRGSSVAHASYADPGVVYSTCDAPDKNSSALELRQGRFDPVAQYRTEQRERFAHHGPQALDLPYKAEVAVHLGDDCPELLTQSKTTHGRISPEETQRASSLRAAGAGSLVPTSIWPKPVRCNPIDGGPRTLDNQDLGTANGVRFGRNSHNRSAIVMEANVRNPVLGLHIPHAAHAAPAHVGVSSTEHIVKQANDAVPHLRSLGALRPHC